MPKLLSPSQIEQYRDQGFIHPIRVMSKAEALALRARLERFERETGGPLKGSFRHKSHLLFTWLAELVRQPRILDAVEDLYDGDLLCWSSNFFIKERESPAFVSWHQDSTYWGLDRPDVVSAWVAFTPASDANGAMRVIPGSHKLDQIAHRDTFAKHNLLTRGQEIAVDVDEREAVSIELEPGEMSLHHVRLVHGSPPNLSEDRRIGFAIRYVPTSVRQIIGTDSATLVRGTDRFGHFEPEPAPAADLDPAMLELHRQITERNAQILYRGTGVESFNDPRGVGLR
ncbi:MAG TPA: phytanoyl-CoA dioxygenase family protein [Hyphomicrobium sp.]|jgi:non-haem Fe2+, alpha-ketoglutarate-dependent halogenase|nr:phytanoyl-CoA dioxygenase family protein [Hyphomicrobium sp.]